LLRFNLPDLLSFHHPILQQLAALFCYTPPICRQNLVDGQYQLLRLEKLVRIDRLLNQSLFHLVESSGIEENLDVALIQNQMHDKVKYEVKSGVVTLSGEVNSQDKRDNAEKVATNVANVKQVVNDLQVKDQKASSSR
jgi:BON domain